MSKWNPKNMQVQYRISENDYVNTMKLSVGNRMQKLSIVCLLTTVPLIFIAYYTRSPLREGAIMALIACFAAGMMVAYILPLIARRDYRKYKAIQGILTVELLDHELRIGAETGETRLAWDKILKWRHNEHYILIFLMPRLFYVVPKSVESSGFNVSMLIDKLSQQVGPAA